MTDGCIIKSVTLFPGEVFTLPPGANVLFVDDPSIITSECTEIPTTPTECYVVMVNSSYDGDGETEYLEPGKSLITGFTFNGNYTAFSSPYTNNQSGIIYGQIGAAFFNIIAIAEELKSKLGAIIEYKYAAFTNIPNDSIKQVLVIKTIAAIGDNLSLQMQEAANIHQNGVIYLNVPFIKRSSLSDFDAEGIPECT